MFHCPVGVWVIEQRAIISNATVRSPTVCVVWWSCWMSIKYCTESIYLTPVFDVQVYIRTWLIFCLKIPWYRTPNAKTLILLPSSDFNQELGTLAIDSKYIFFDVWMIIQVRDKCRGSIEDTDGERPLN